MELDANMSLLYQAEGFFTIGKMKMVTSPAIAYVDIFLTTNGIIFEGKAKSVFNAAVQFSIDSRGYHYEIPWSQFTRAYKSKSRLIHTVTIESNINQYYTIAPLDRSTSFGKRNAQYLADAINDAHYQAIQSKPRQNFCIKCGNRLMPGFEYCAECGQKIK